MFSLIVQSMQMLIFVARHMPAVLARGLSERLALHCGCRAGVVTGKTHVERPGISIAEGGRHMDIARARRVRVLAVDLTCRSDEGLCGAGVLRQRCGRIATHHGSTCMDNRVPRVILEEGVGLFRNDPAADQWVTACSGCGGQTRILGRDVMILISGECVTEKRAVGWIPWRIRPRLSLEI